MQGKWTGSSKWNTLVDPLNGEPFIKIAEVDENEIQVFPLNVTYIDIVLFLVSILLAVGIRVPCS